MRTKIDFSKHIIEETKSEFHHTWFLRIPGTYNHCIRYTNIDSVLVVTGDFGNWMFCRRFAPSADGHVSDGYWIEKLTISSSQQGTEFSSVMTRAALLEMINGGAEEYGYEGDRLAEYIEYLNECLEVVDDELDYTAMAYRGMPSFLDAESVIFCTDTKFWLKAVFDGFDEMCKRVKEQELQTA